MSNSKIVKNWKWEKGNKRAGIGKGKGEVT